MAEARHRRRTDRLFGQIAVELGIITPEKLDEALDRQAAQAPSTPLGLILMDMRLVAREDLEQILEAQRKIVERQRERGKDRRDDTMFGKVAVRLGFLTQDQLNECLEIQKNDGPESLMRLGELMTRRGIVGPEQVRRVIEVQSGMAVPCPACSTLHNVVMFMPGASIPCRKCSGSITVPQR